MKKPRHLDTIICLTMLLLGITMLAWGQYATDSKGGKTFIQEFSPNPNYTKALSPALGIYSTVGYIKLGATTSTAGKMWNSTTKSRAGVTPVTIPANSTLIRGTSPSSKYFIYSGCTGSLERQPDRE